MPDEEMDILADFGPDAFTEDIDIDLDLAAVVHPDEDLELADFDHSADLQLFNSDGRDELMAEGDDASYGMVDADDIDHTETITVTEDIDIDLVAPDNDVAWLGDATEASASFNDVHEIDFVDAGHNDEHAAEAYAALDSNDTSLTDNIELNTARSQSPQKAIGGILGEQHRPAVIGNDFNKPINAQLVAGNHEPLELSLDAPTGVTGLSQDLEAGQAALSSSLHGGTEIKDIVDTGAYDSTNAEVQESDDVLGETSLLENDEGNAQHELGEAIGQPDSSRQVLQESTSGKISPPPEDIATVATSPDEIRKPELDAHTSIQSPPPSERLEANEDFEGEHAVNSPRNTGNGLTEDVPNHEEQSHLLSDATDKAGNTDVTNQPTEEGTQLQSDNVADREDLIARHRPVISYKRTYYRLLAESEHDDPDTYFLKDSSHLESSLDYFLSALRQVVSGEVSPLDELVLYVDGLGLEFAESSSPTLLAEHTYTELLLLYDQLTLNDGAESVPPFFCYLSVRPCGAQRLSALKESAKAGHGLSQVAVYREFTPEEDLEEVESHSNVDANSNAGDCEDETLDIEHSDHSTEHIHGNEQGSKDSKEEQENAAHDSSPQQVDPEGQIDVVGRDGVNPEAEDGFYDEFNLSTATHDDVNAPLINNEHNAVSEDASAAESGSIEEPSVDTSNEDVDAVVSADTSATVTANGDDNDEIGYSDDEDEAAAAGTTNSDVSADSKTPILPDVPPDDDEITWESDHEELSVDDKPSTVQVSPVAGKRARSDSISLAETSGQNDVKRQRS